MKLLLLLTSLFSLVACSNIRLNKITYHRANMKITGHVHGVTEEHSESIATLSENDFAMIDNPTIVKSKKDNLNITVQINNEQNLRKKEINCDVIILKSGSSISATQIEVSSDELKFKKCEDTEGSNYFVPISSVQQINYADGSTQSFDGKKAAPTVQSITQTAITNATKPKTHVLSILSFIFGLGLNPILGFIFGIIALKKIGKDPTRFKGMGLASVGLVMSTIWLFLLIYLLLGVI
jgi:hypothetical protein